MTEHLSEGTLLRYLDGELSPRAKRTAAKHLESCWNCRASLGALERDIEVIVEAQHSVLTSLVYPRGKRRADFRRKLEEADGSKTTATRFRRLQGGTVSGLLAACSILICAFFWFLPARVTAKQVLDQLDTTDGRRLRVQPQQLLLQRVLIKRTENRSLLESTGTVDCWMLSGKVYWRETSISPAVKALKRHATQARIADLLPLSPAAYHAWLEQAGGSPHLQTARSGQSVALTSQNTVPSGDLQQVRIVVTMATWRVDTLTLKFANESYDVSEERLSVVPQNQAPGDVLASLEPAGKPIQATAFLRRSSHPNVALENKLDDTELQVRWQLHRLHADLGEPIQLTRKANHIIVTARDVTPARRAEIDRLLRDQRDVLLRFDPLPGVSPKIRQTVITLTYRRPAPIGALRQNDQRVTEFFGGFPRREAFTGAVLEQESRLQSHLYAVRNLANRFDMASEAALSDATKQSLHLLVHDHLETAAGELASLQATLDPLFRQFAVADQATVRAEPPASLAWQTCSDAVLASINSADRSLREFLTTADASVAPEQASPAARDSLQQAERSLQYCLAKQ